MGQRVAPPIAICRGGTKTIRFSYPRASRGVCCCASSVRIVRQCHSNLSPFYSGSAHAVLGGWHVPWPDGDWDELAERPLLVWTLEDSEPWVEVWADGKGFEVKQRIT
jgi:hypothetical protein